MLELHKLSFDSNSTDNKTKHIMAVGSILGGRGEFNATVWGSGIRSFSSVRNLAIRKFYKKLDIRAVRGPLTREALLSCGYKCPEVYGDPDVLMPMIYSPNTESKRGTVLITHYSTEQKAFHKMENITLLDIKTKDYKKFIDSIASAEKVISSSLNGIIIAETYGIPAVFLRNGIESETLKFYDWYFSTERYNVKVANTLEQALALLPMELPDLQDMRTNLVESFPYDLWE